MSRNVSGKCNAPSGKCNATSGKYTPQQTKKRKREDNNNNNNGSNESKERRRAYAQRRQRLLQPQLHTYAKQAQFARSHKHADPVKMEMLTPLFCQLMNDKVYQFHKTNDLLTRNDYQWDEMPIALPKEKQGKRKPSKNRKPMRWKLTVEDQDIVIRQDDMIRLSEHRANLNKLSPQQLELFFRAVNQRENLCILGGGGRGKSFLCRCIVYELSMRGYNVVICAPTGIAADNIQGITLDSFLKIHPEAYEKHSRAAHKIASNRLQSDLLLDFRLVDVLVIDELSMLSKVKWSAIHFRGCAANDTYAPFGGKQVLGFGDFSQLPPIEKEKVPLTFAFESPYWDSVFPRSQIVELLACFRQNDPVFVGFLDRLRIGNVTDEEMFELMHESQAMFANRDPTLKQLPYVYLYGTREKTNAHNQHQQDLLWANVHETHKHVDLTSPCPTTIGVPLEHRIVKIQYTFQQWTAKDMNVIQKLQEYYENEHKSWPREIRQDRKERFVTPYTRTVQQCRELLNKHAVADLEFRLSVGTRVMLSHNINVQERLVRNKAGVITHFEWDEDDEEGEADPCVLFDGHSESIRIRRWHWKVPGEHGNYEASQYPLEYAWAITIHKSQSLTLDRMVVDLSEVFSEGQCYVALSRAKKREGLVISNYKAGAIKTHPKVLAFYQRTFPEAYPLPKVSLPEPLLEPPPDEYFSSSSSRSSSSSSCYRWRPTLEHEPISIPFFQSPQDVRPSSLRVELPLVEAEVEPIPIRTTTTTTMLNIARSMPTMVQAVLQPVVQPETQPVVQFLQTEHQQQLEQKPLLQPQNVQAINIQQENDPEVLWARLVHRRTMTEIKN